MRRGALAMSPPLRPIAMGIDQMMVYRADPLDVRPQNMGRRKDNSVALFDLGRTPIETLTVAPGDMDTACPNEASLKRAVFDMLNVAPSYRQCRVVNRGALMRVMNKHGWSRQEVEGTAGFHTEDHRLLIHKGDEWAILHEMVHAAGIIDKDMARWLCEGLTEAVAQDIAKKKKWRHSPTYASEVKLVRTTLCPLVNMKPVELAQVCVARPRSGGRAVAALLQKHTGVPRQRWLSTIGPKVESPHDFKALVRVTQRKARKVR
jgi:hypothetical protein